MVDIKRKPIKSKRRKYHCADAQKHVTVQSKVMAETVCCVFIMSLRTSGLGLSWMGLHQLLRVCGCGFLSLFLALFSPFSFAMVTVLSRVEAPVPFWGCRCDVVTISPRWSDRSCNISVLGNMFLTVRILDGRGMEVRLSFVETGLLVPSLAGLCGIPCRSQEWWTH